MHEGELVRRLQAGDADAFDPLYAMYVEKAVRVAYLVTGSEPAAEDAAQEAFVAVLRRIGDLRNPDRFRSWFFSILLNGARRAARRGRRWLFVPLRPGPDAGADPAEAAERSDRARTLQVLIDQLPDTHRTPVILRYYAELSDAEIAAALGIPEGTVKSRLHHARQKLRQALGEEGTDLAAR